MENQKTNIIKSAIRSYCATWRGENSFIKTLTWNIFLMFTVFVLSIAIFFLSIFLGYAYSHNVQYLKIIIRIAIIFLFLVSSVTSVAIPFFICFSLNRWSKRYLVKKNNKIAKYIKIFSCNMLPFIALPVCLAVLLIITIQNLYYILPMFNNFFFQDLNSHVEMHKKIIEYKASQPN
jgi:hypothetical protein